MNPPDSAEQDDNQARVGKYRVVAELAEGGMSKVYKGWDDDIDRAVAIKILHGDLISDAEVRGRFKREASSVGRVSHPNIAQVYDTGITDDGKPYIIMEFIDGVTLERLIREKADLSLLQTLEFVVQACHGLRAAYRADIIHRDIKPGNLIIEARNQSLRVVDFGLAKALWDDSFQTKTGSVVGTPRYMSPEQCLGQALDHRSDIYSTGATFYHVLAARPPFDAETSVALMMKHARAPLTPLREVNPDIALDVNDIIMRMMAKDPNDRYQDYDALIADLESAQLAERSRRDRTRAAQAAPDDPTLLSAAAVAGAATPEAPVAARGGGPGLGSPPPPSYGGGITVEVPPEVEQRRGKFRPVLLALTATVLLLGVATLVTLPRSQRSTSGKPSIYVRLLNLLTGRGPAGMLSPEEMRYALMVENESRMLHVVDAIDHYMAMKGEFPAILRDLERARVLTDTAATDVWGQRFVFRTDSSFVCTGEDEVEGTSDDWVMGFRGTLRQSPPDLQNAHLDLERKESARRRRQ